MKYFFVSDQGSFFVFILSGEALFEYPNLYHALPPPPNNSQVKQLAAEGDVLYDNPDKSIISLPALPPEPEPLFEWYNSPEVHGPLEEFVGDHLVATWRDRCESYDIHH